jgi:DNA-binding GntR family transcriptional regulator
MKAAAGRAITRKSRTAPAITERARGAQGSHAYQALRALVRDGVLRPGDRVIEATIAAQLGISRTPVRDAIRRLESEGLLDHESRTGLIVARLDRRSVAELYEMREVLEGTAARLFTRHASDLEVDQLADLIAEERALDDQAQALAAHNQKFHSQIHRGAHNRHLEKALRAVNAVRWLLGPTQMLAPDRASEALKEHGELVRAIQKREADAAETIARKHVRSAQMRRLKTLFPQED